MVQPRCCIVICRNAKAGADRRIGYHPFPTNESVRSKWIEFVGVNPERFRWRNKFVCSAHFLHSERADERGLLEGAVPMVFAPEEDEQEVEGEVEYLERDDVMVSDKPPPPLVVQGEIVEAKLSGVVSSVVEEVELRALFCRICLKKQPDLLPLGSKLHNAPLGDVIYTIAGIRLGADAQLPTKICARCIEKADMAFNVRMEFVHNERILKNLVKNKQLENHYQSYDQQQHESRSFNEEYLNSLLANVKQEVLEPKLECTYDDVELATNADETYIEEHLYEEEDESHEVIPDPDGTESSYGHPLSLPPSEERETYVVANNSANVMRAVLTQESVQKEEPSEKKPKEAKPQKFVFSWKELYKPKATPKAKKKRKIVGYLPKPDLVPNTCYYCNTVHDDPEALDQHLEQHVGLLPYTCLQCNNEQFPAVCKTLVNLNKHLMSHQFPYQCDYCWQRMATEVAYETHMQNIHEADSGDGFTCDYCGMFFGAKSKFRNHMAKHRAVEEGRYKCEFCERVFGNSSLLKRHRRIHTGEKPFECNKCGKKFNHEANFRNHKRSHIGEKAYVCDECGKNFINSTALRYHMAEHYPDDPQYRVQQNIQRTRYGNSSSSVSTMNAIGVREYRCDVEGCCFVTTMYRAYFYHRNVHLRRYECETCGKRFPMKATLKKHNEQVHQGVVPERNLPCPYCPKMFSEKQKLQMHVDIHENNRKYKCGFCDKTFIQKVNCTAHERIHTGERPYTCRFCPTGFITSSGRKKHEKTHPELNGQGQLAVEDQKPEMVEIIQQQEYLEAAEGVEMDVLGDEEEEEGEGDVVYDEEVHEENEDYEIEVAEELEATEEELVEFALEEASHE